MRTAKHNWGRDHRAKVIWLVAMACATCAPKPAPLLQTTIEGTQGTAIGIEAASVALNSEDATQKAIGAFIYAGGIELRGVGTPRLHGLSDLHVSSEGHLVAVTDEGNFFEARIVTDRSGRLSGLSQGRLTPLMDEDGNPLREKFRADAEGVAVLSNGDRLVSFERDHRIWRYPVGNGPPRPAPKPDAAFPENFGMEAIAAYPFAGPDAYLVGSEGGQVWLCESSGGCRETALGARMKTGFGLTAIAPYGSQGALGLLSRAFDPEHGVRVAVMLIEQRALEGSPGHVLAEFTMAAPLTRDNFEGLAIVPRPDGALRLYLLSDDNFSAAQRTYLMAFDWKPTAP
jgi:hypothetical protein